MNQLLHRLRSVAPAGPCRCHALVTIGGRSTVAASNGEAGGVTEQNFNGLFGFEERAGLL